MSPLCLTVKQGPDDRWEAWAQEGDDQAVRLVSTRHKEVAASVGARWLLERTHEASEEFPFVGEPPEPLPDACRANDLYDWCRACAYVCPLCLTRLDGDGEAIDHCVIASHSPEEETQNA